jgi:3-phenylpropionate/trans-cinnamate dioxygenase ferredoxin reductase subunit
VARADPERIVVVGASLAGLRAAEAVRSAGYDARLTVIGAEPHRPYNRPPLSKEFLARRADARDCAFEHDDLEADWLLERVAVGLDREARTVQLRGGERVPYDRLIVATGAAARPWPGAGGGLDGVLTLRTLDDAVELAERLDRARRLLVVGAGFVGCEVAATARELGVEVTVVELAALPLAPLGSEVGTWCAERSRAHGVDLRTETAVEELMGDRVLRAARLSDGDLVECDVAVIALGARPAADWLGGSGVVLRGGSLVCDATLTSVSDPRVLGAGDVVSWPHPLVADDLLRVEHWSNAVDQGATAGRNATLDTDERHVHDAIPSFWSDQFGRRIQSVGLPARAQEVRIVEGSPAEDRFVAAGFAEGRLISAVAVDAGPRLRKYRRALLQAQATESVLTGADASAPNGGAA